MKTNDKRFYADVELPFHVWVREAGRWVLRDARDGAAGAATPPQDAPRSADRGGTR